MTDDCLRAEFERLADLYPELSHCLIVWLGTESHDPEISLAIIRRHGFTPLGLGSTLANDSRTEAFYTWSGSGGDERAAAAVADFEALAPMAAAHQSLRPFPGRVSPRVLCSVSDGSVDRATGAFISLGGRHDPKIADWLGHLHASPGNSVTDVSVRTADNKEFGGELHTLPLDLFRASAFALHGINDENSPTNGKNEQKDFVRDPARDDQLRRLKDSLADDSNKGRDKIEVAREITGEVVGADGKAKSLIATLNSRRRQSQRPA